MVFAYLAAAALAVVFTLVPMAGALAQLNCYEWERNLPQCQQRVMPQYQQRYNVVPLRQVAMPAERRMSSGYQPLVDVTEPTAEDEGTIVISLSGRYLVQYGQEVSSLQGKPLPARAGHVWRTGWRYSIGVGREGFRDITAGLYYVGRKEASPTWYPTARMVRDDPAVQRISTRCNGQVCVPGGRNDNPLGKFALYLHNARDQNGQRAGADSQLRVHGTDKPWTVGTAASSGCFRMTNEDVGDLFDHVPEGTKVVVID